MSASDRFVVVGNPENRRFELFHSAVREAGSCCECVAYADLLSGRKRIGDQLAAGTILRVDSPGENFSVEKQLIARGAETAQRDPSGCQCISADEALRLDEDHGRIRYPRQWYYGFRNFLREIQSQAAEISGVHFMNQTDDIITMFDKEICRATLQRIPVPTAPCLSKPRDYEELRQLMRHAEMPRVFVKLCNGSSASGVIALQVGQSRIAARTSVEVVQTFGEVRLYNSLRLRTYHDEREVAAIVDFLCRESVVIERWLPKATWNGMAFDLRILAFPTGMRHVVVRQSREPITNLHLGNSRGEWPTVRAQLGESLSELESTCGKISRAFARSHCVAIDALISPDFRQHTVLEVNAFGDLLPGVLHNGKNSYQAIVADFLAQ